jgi:hypothetical protein
MSWIAFILGFVLALAGGAALVASIDLLTTELGLLYATCGAVALTGGVITIAIGLLIGRVDALRGALTRERADEPAAMERAERPVPPLLAGIEPTSVPEPEAPPRSVEAPAPLVPEPEAAMAPPSAPEGVADLDSDLEVAPINENRKGHLPALEELEHAAASPGPPPSLIGRYSAGGADYSIYSDGSIEAQTSDGEFKFASMREFKDFIAAKKS